MLEHLFGSRTRVKLLSLFLRHPDEALFVRELTRRVGTQINAVRRELTNLVRLGLIEEAIAQGMGEDGEHRPGVKRKYYRISKTFPLLSEVTALIVKAQLLLEQRLDHHLLALGDVRYLAFLGLFVGKAAPVDIFLVADKLDKRELDRLIHVAEEELGTDVRYSLMTTDEYKYRKDITDRFLYGILEAPKNVLLDRLHEKHPA